MSSVRDRLPRRGLTAREVAERVGCSVRTAQAWTSEPREVYLARANERRARILELHAQGLGVRAIARELECNPGLVSSRLKEAREAGLLPAGDE